MPQLLKFPRCSHKEIWTLHTPTPRITSFFHLRAVENTHHHPHLRPTCTDDQLEQILTRRIFVLKMVPLVLLTPRPHTSSNTVGVTACPAGKVVKIDVCCSQETCLFHYRLEQLRGLHCGHHFCRDVCLKVRYQLKPRHPLLENHEGWLQFEMPHERVQLHPKLYANVQAIVPWRGSIVLAKF